MIAWRTVLWVVLHVHSRPWVVSGGVTAGAGQLRSAPSMYFSCRWNVIPVWLSVHFVANLGMCIDVTCHTVLRGGSAQDRNVWGRGRAERSHESPNAAVGSALRHSGNTQHTRIRVASSHTSVAGGSSSHARIRRSNHASVHSSHVVAGARYSASPRHTRAVPPRSAPARRLVAR